MKIYLAGKMGGRMGHEVLEERRHAKSLCRSADIECIDPGESEYIDPSNFISLRMDYLTMKAFVAKDEYAIKNCDALLVLAGDLASEGTGWEMGYAHFALKIPVVLVAPKRVCGDLMGFSNIKADAIFATVEEAIDFIGENYANAIRKP